MEDMTMLLHYRRRCAWCGVQLRWWQLNMCLGCKRTLKHNHGQTDVRMSSRWFNFPDGLE